MKNVGKPHLGDLTDSFRPPLPEQDPGSALHKLGVLDELEHHRSLNCNDDTNKLVEELVFRLSLDPKVSISHSLT